MNVWKQLITKFLVFVCLVGLLGNVFGCADTKVINGVEYDTYGLLNKDDKKNPTIQYELVWGNIVWGVFFVKLL